GGFLGRSADPWLLHGAPESRTFEVSGLGLPADVPPVRLAGRRSLLGQVNAHLDAVQRAGVLDDHSARVQRAFDLISAPAARAAFDLSAEPPALRERYGMTRFGQSCLLARRLVEVGVPFVRVNWTRVVGALNNGHWDTHSQNTRALKQLMPI